MHLLVRWPKRACKPHSQADQCSEAVVEMHYTGMCQSRGDGLSGRVRLQPWHTIWVVALVHMHIVSPHAVDMSESACMV